MSGPTGHRQTPDEVKNGVVIETQSNEGHSSHERKMFPRQCIKQVGMHTIQNSIVGRTKARCQPQHEIQQNVPKADQVLGILVLVVQCMMNVGLQSHTSSNRVLNREPNLQKLFRPESFGQQSWQAPSRRLQARSDSNSRSN